VVEGLPFDEGSVVTVLARERDETFELSPEEAELLLSVTEADRGRLFLARKCCKAFRAARVD
jgi:hypothetical protein